VAARCKATTCGDTYINSVAENCDDGNNVTEKCAYNGGTCNVCDSSCHSAAGATQACNDGIVQSAFEACDDGNATCGSCSADCQTAQSAAATGTIIVVRSSSIDDGDNFTLDDGFHAPVTFEYRNNGSAGAGHIEIGLNSDNSAGVRNKTASAINAAAVTIASGPTGAVQAASPSKTVTFTTTDPHKLATGVNVIVSGVGVAGYNGTWLVTGVTSTTFTADVATTGLAASGGGTAKLGLDITAVGVTNTAQVSLTNKHLSSFGNVAIVANPSTTNISVSGMGSGLGNVVGKGGDCAAAQVCTSNPDCESAVCSGSGPKTCQ
jgi:hypothetical protein